MSATTAPGMDDQEARELAASERVFAGLRAYDEALAEADPAEPDHEERVFDAMKAAIATADALRPDGDEAPPQTRVPLEAMSPEGKAALRTILRRAEGLLPGVLLSATLTVARDGATTCRLRVAEETSFPDACRAVKAAVEALRAELVESAAGPAHGPAPAGAP